MRLRRAADGREFRVELLSRTASTVSVRIDGRQIEAVVEPLFDGSLMITVAGRRRRVFALHRGPKILVAAGALQFGFESVEQARPNSMRAPLVPAVTAPMPGRVLSVLVAEGEEIKGGQALVVLEAMKMQTRLCAEGPGVVRRILVGEGATVEHGTTLIELSPPATAPSARATRPQGR